MNASLHVVAAGPLTTVQDLGRPGYAAQGVSPSGAADPESLAAANRAVGNAPDAAGLELTLGGLLVEARGEVLLAFAGADCGAGEPGVPLTLRTGSRLRLRSPAVGVRTYLAVRGGVDVPLVLGSRSTDVLGGLGPPVVRDGDVLAVGEDATTDAGAVSVPPVPLEDVVAVRVHPGPRAMDDDALRILTSAPYTVSAKSNRIAVRLAGPVVPTTDADSEGLVVGAVQVPPDGAPIVFLADHPVTGGYPVVAVVVSSDVRLVAQRRPGQHIAFAPA